MVWRIVPFIFAALLLGAHFLRDGQLAAMVLCLLAPLLLLLKQRWSLIVLQALAYTGAGIWLVTTLDILQQRLKLGLPWVRLVIILGAVTLFTLWAGLLLNSTKVKENYPP
jgi:hypothetical protein